MKQNENSPTISVWSGNFRFFRRNVYEDKKLINCLREEAYSKKNSSSNFLSNAIQSNSASLALGQN